MDQLKERKDLRVASINILPNGSTGKIMLSISELVRKNGGKAITFSTRTSGKKLRKLPYVNAYHHYYGSYIENNLHYVLGYFSGYNGLFSHFATWRLLRRIKKFQPLILHLHNLHSSYIQLPMLFRYIKKNSIPVVWTLHDCWAFTGQCPHFTMANCDKWKSGCHDCPQYRQYPASYVDRTKAMWKLKKQWFTGVPNMTIVTPSQWLADLVKESFLKDYPVKVINNGIDLSTFQPTASDFRKRYGLENKFVILGVAFDWGKRKGLDVFIKLAEHLDDRYKIVLVGTNDDVDKLLPDSMLSIHRTQNQQELAEIYTAADVFANPTREEVLGMVNVEALACGTPVITFRSGGSPECIDETCGSVVACDDFEGFVSMIEALCDGKQVYSQQACMDRAKHFDADLKFREYLDLYRENETQGEHKWQMK